MPKPDICHWWWLGDAWHTECQTDAGRDTMTDLDRTICEMVFRSGATYCPFCGGEWFVIGPDEVHDGGRC